MYSNLDVKSPTTGSDVVDHGTHLSPFTETEDHCESVPIDKPIVVGIYGIPGCGKSFLLDQLKQELDEEHYKFFEGSQVIGSLVPGGLAAFQELNNKPHWRERAIDTIGKCCSETGKTGVVAGHYILWPENDLDGHRVSTPNDWRTYTHILYLNILPDIIAQRRLDDRQRPRSHASIDHLRKWQQTEERELRGLCSENKIVFSLVSESSTCSTPLQNRIATLLRYFRHHTEEANLRRAESRLDEIIVGYGDQAPLDTVLVMDADRTLASQDTGSLFWKTLSLRNDLKNPRDNDDPLKGMFSKLGYSYTAFCQATLLYEESTDDSEFDVICEQVASAVKMHPEFVSLLKLVEHQDHIAAVIVTCGLRHVWDKILTKEGLSEKVKIIGGGRVSDGFVVTPSVKAALVSRFRDEHHLYVLAYGDSPLDLDMLSEAHEAIVVVGEEAGRSKTMEEALRKAINDNGLRARQVLLPPHASPRLDTDTLPLIQLDHPDFIQSVLRRRHPASAYRIFDATNRSSAKLLMTPMRDARVAGPALRAAHSDVGTYLAIQYVSEIIGLEEYEIPHVQGTQTYGHRLRHEQETTIVALMRGGEPMAFGVSDAFPLAMFLQATQPAEVKSHHLQKQHTVLLVDSVINSGKSVAEFIRHIRNLDATIRILVIAGTVQAKSLSEGAFFQALERDTNLSLVALRRSDNKFTGTKATDTGNRLFNTTHMA